MLVVVYWCGGDNSLTFRKHEVSLNEHQIRGRKLNHQTSRVVNSIDPKKEAFYILFFLGYIGKGKTDYTFGNATPMLSKLISTFNSSVGSLICTSFSSWLDPISARRSAHALAPIKVCWSVQSMESRRVFISSVIVDKGVFSICPSLGEICSS